MLKKLSVFVTGIALFTISAGFSEALAGDIGERETIILAQGVKSPLRPEDCVDPRLQALLDANTPVIILAQSGIRTPLRPEDCVEAGRQMESTAQYNSSAFATKHAERGAAGPRELATENGFNTGF